MVDLRILVFLVACCGASRPQHLVVTVHGLGGYSTDLGYVGRRLEAESTGAIVVLACKCNEGRTFDGLAAGGSRVADEVARFLAEAEGFETISFIGNSLGGLYARYAVFLLFANNSVAGLRPAAFVTTASPHLGVRSSLYAPLLAPLAALFAPAHRFSRSARDVLGQTATLRDMTDNAFLQPLRAFRARRAYAASDGDFMVPFESALFASSDLAESAMSRATSEVKCLEVPVRRPLRRADDEAIASALDSLGWSKCVIALPRDTGSILDVLPLAHNKVVALERSGVKRILAPFERTDDGKPAMDDLARWLWQVVSTAEASCRGDALAEDPALR